MFDTHRVLLLGATGLMGRTIIEQAVGHQSVSLVALARREIDLPEGARMEVVVADSEKWKEAIATIKAQTVLCGLGTTMRKSGFDQESFRAVDHDLVLASAKAAQDAGADHFVAFSSVGASVHAKNFYLRTKAEVEDALIKLRFRRLDILRPGLLRGRREGDIRPLEKAAMVMSPVTDIFMQGEKSRYRSIGADDLARAALRCASEKAGGKFFHHHAALMRQAGRFEREPLPA